MAVDVDPLPFYCRRERPSAGAQLCALEQADGWRYQLFAVRHEVALVQVR